MNRLEKKVFIYFNGVYDIERPFYSRYYYSLRSLLSSAEAEWNEV